MNMTAAMPKTRADMPSNSVPARRVQVSLAVLLPSDDVSTAGYAERAADARTVNQRANRGFHPCENQRSFASSLQRLFRLVSWCSFWCGSKAGLDTHFAPEE